MRVLILCTGNSCRSQMAEGLLGSLDPRLEVHSAGTVPAERVHPLAIRVMAEIGVPIADGAPKNVSQFLDQAFDYVITVCDDADQNCPYFRGAVGKRMHIGLEDPANASGAEDEILPVFRACRDQIKSRFGDLYEQEMRAKIEQAQ